MAVAFIALGSNLGDRRTYLTWAVDQIGQLPETRILRVSSFLETEPIGGPAQGRYLNGVATIETRLEPVVLFRHLQKIEVALGRPKAHPFWGPRIIDLDLLSYDGLVVDTPELTLPHPRMHERNFVLIPLAEIAPDWQHPTFRESVRELLGKWTDASRPAAE